MRFDGGCWRLPQLGLSAMEDRRSIDSSFADNLGEAMHLTQQFFTIKMLGLTSRARLHQILEDAAMCRDLVLDVGCGTGELLISLLLRGFDVIGLDVDIHQLENLNSALKQAGENCQLVAADVSKLPFRQSSFGTLYCTEVIDMLQDDNNALSELVRVLQRDGICTMSVPNENYPIIYDPLNRLLDRMGIAHLQLGIWSPEVKKLYESSVLLSRLRCLGLKPFRLNYIGKWLVPLLENYLSLLFYYRVLAPKYRKKAGLQTYQTGSMIFDGFSKFLELVIRLDMVPSIPGTHFVISARKTRISPSYKLTGG
jgi:ubiquinone/menaquinone biosynthesis C-methylase UbiE